jgi:hypothetical protein
VFGGSWGQHVILKNSSVENHKFNVLAIWILAWFYFCVFIIVSLGNL